MKSIKNYLPVDAVIRPVPFEQEKKVLLQEIRKIEPKVQAQFGSVLKVFTGRLKMDASTDAQFWIDFSALSPIQKRDLEAAARAPVDCFLKVYLLSAQLLFKSPLAGFEKSSDRNGYLRFAFPEQMFKVQRRKHLRVPIPKQTAAYARIPGVGERKILDISLMGLRVQLEKGDDRTISENREMKDFGLIFNGEEHAAQVIVRYLDPKVVGLQVAYMNAVDRQWLKDFLMGQIRILLNDPAQIQNLT